MNKFRSFVLIALIVSGAIWSQTANARISGDAIYMEKFRVPAFVPDVRELIVNAARVRGWKLIDESPGELTFELQHAKSHMDVVAKASYSKTEFSFRKISVKTFQCDSGLLCEIDPVIVQRWMVSLRREAGVALLRLAIQDAGASVPGGRAPVAEAE